MNVNDDDLDDIFLNSFLKEYNNITEQGVQFVKEGRMIAEQKRQKLEPIANFLQKFVDVGVKVYHRETFEKSFASRDYNTTVDFDYYEATSSKAWEPGISIMIDHPAQIEIAIPNHEEEGLFVLNISTEHPDSLVLKHKFTSVKQLCQALAIFIQKNTISIDTNPKEVISKIENKVRFDGSTLKEVETKRMEQQNTQHYLQDGSERPSSTLSKIGEYFKKNHNNNEEE